MPKPNARGALAALVPLIYQISRSICFRSRASEDEREDFESFLFATFLGNECRVLEQYRGEGSFAGYLRVAICRLLLDYRVRRWGKWRPSATALRLGEVAVELERLIERDGYSRGEAVRHLRSNRGVDRSELELLDLAGQLPNRPGRRFEGEEALEGLPARCGAGERTDRCVAEQEAARVRCALARALRELPPEERRLLVQRFDGASTVAEIARRSGASQRRLYRTLERILGDLRRRLETLGIDREAAQSVLGHL